MQHRIHIMRRAIAGVLLATMSAMPVSAASYLVNWTGAGGWSLDGTFSFSDDLLGEIIDEDDLDRLTFDVRLEGESQGTADLIGAGAANEFSFDSQAGTFLVDVFNNQNWNYPGSGVGFVSGSVGQAVWVDGIFEGRIELEDQGSTLVAERIDPPVVPLPAGAVLMLTALGTAGLILRRRRNRSSA